MLQYGTCCTNRNSGTDRRYGSIHISMAELTGQCNMDKHRRSNSSGICTGCTDCKHILQETGYQRYLRYSEQCINTDNGIWQPYIRNNRNGTVSMLQHGSCTAYRNGSTNRRSGWLHIPVAKLAG